MPTLKSKKLIFLIRLHHIPPKLLNLKNSINKDNICIVDLRQESHGMINDLAISFLNPYKDLNNGFTTEQTIKAENSLLNKIILIKNIN